MIGDSGATYTDEGGRWVTYLSSDGIKIVKNIKSGKLTNRKWRVDDNGVFCQTLMATGKEQCERENIVYLENGQDIHAIIMDGKDTDLRFTVAPGNTENL